ncbi:hypothetical protein GCM10009616_08130 [Microlunatus lacustris]
MRFPTAALAVLSVAAAAFVTSVNASIWASYWDSDPSSANGGSGSPYLEATARYQTYRFWVKVTRFLYIVGVYTLWFGLAVAFFPKDVSPWRLLPLLPLLLAIVAELTLHRIAPPAINEPAVWIEEPQEPDQSGER